MWSRFFTETKSPRSLEREPMRSGCPELKVTFRPPSLSATVVVNEPFERAGPRLRTMEFFSRELSS